MKHCSLKLLEPDFFEGFMLGVLAVTIFTAYNHGWAFNYVTEGHGLGPSQVYGLSTAIVIIYTSIVFILYEFLTNRNAFQSIVYTLFGYFYLDSLVQAHFGFAVYLPRQLYGDTTFLNTLSSVLNNPDLFLTYLLFVFLFCFHTGTLDKLTRKYLRFSIDCSFHFDLKRLIPSFSALAFLYYFIMIPLRTPASIVLPLCAYALSSKHLLTRRKQV